ncbi:MAG: DUF6900 domain-containing protein [Phycisphaerales bacterium]|jgi:hypothetical protein|nr:hypothetical protein [Phycisphaeraceae bacterium]
MSSSKISLDATAKTNAMSAAMEAARTNLELETLATRGRDHLDFHDLSVATLREVIAAAFEAGYSAGLSTGYRQGRGDACREARGMNAQSKPRNPITK